jgi:hypothetical protein
MPAVRWPTHLHRATFLTVLLADAILMPTAYLLAERDLKSWLIAGPVFLLNLPAIPLAILFSILGDDSTSGSGSQAILLGIAMNICLAIASSWVWAFIVRSWQKRHESLSH